ncbi:MAG: diacylglycerol/lipid kinase family protein [Betaproteobacteria bacterium]
MRVTLIHNPGAGNGERGGAKRLKAMLRDAGHAVRYQSSKDEDWDEALEAPADIVAVAGGDGTVSRVAKRMVGRGVPIAPLPGGTANNIARTLGLAGRHWEELVRGWEGARRVRLDVGVVEAPWGRGYFVEGVGVGLFAALLGRPAAAAVKKHPGAVEKALRRLRKEAARCEALELGAMLDGKDISGRYLLLEALNLSHVGPNLFLAPDSRPGDGQLDVVLVTEEERSRLVHYLEHWQDNRERLAVLPTLQGRRLQIEWTGFALHVDDKLRPKKKAPPEEIAGIVEARMGEAAVELLVPALKKQG